MKGSQRTLHRALPIVASALGDKFGVEVIVSGQEMKTDGQRVWVPAFDPDEPELHDLAYGVIAHEAGGHLRHTDFGIWAETEAGSLRQQMLNVVEDVRIEAALAIEYPGTRRDIGKVMDYLVRRGHMPAMTEEEHPGRVLALHILYKLRTELLGQSALQPAAHATEIVARTIFPAGAMVRLHGLLAEVPNLGSTRDALDLVDLVLQMLKEEERKERERQAEQEAGAQGNPSPQQGSGSAGSNGPDAGQPGSGQGDPQPGAGGESLSPPQADSGRAGKGGTDGSDVQNPSSAGATDGVSSQSQNGTGAGAADAHSRAADGENKAKADALATALAARQDVIGSTDLFKTVAQDLSRSASHATSAWVPNMPLPADLKRQPAAGSRLFASSRLNSGRVRAQLQGLVQASQMEHVAIRRKGRQPDSRRLARLGLGDSRVFVHRDEKRAPNAAVHLLADRSSSMQSQQGGGRRGNKNDQAAVQTYWDVAVESSLALALALEGIAGVNPAVTAFPADGFADGPRRGVIPLLKHGERVSQAVGRFTIGAAGGTPMAEAMWFGAAQLLAQREQRKLMIVVSDGQPHAPEAVQDMIRRCEASNIDVVAIGIALPSILELFPNAVVIKDVRELRAALFQIAKKALIAA